MPEQPVHELPVVLTSFGYRDEYLSELQGMLATAEEHHPAWPRIIGRGRSNGELEVTAGPESFKWTLPVPLRLDGENDWRLVTRMKGWWVAMAWKHSAEQSKDGMVRVLWLDADARLNGPLDFDLDPSAESIVSPWYCDARYNYQTLTTGMVLFQGRPGGVVSEIIDCWSRECQRQIVDLRAPIVPWLDGDQEVLTESVALILEEGRRPALPRLNYDKYCGLVTLEGERRPGALVDQWMMSWRMKKKEYLTRVWPPPEELRRGKAAHA
jgi:hypothetical protein